jgi:hypothetical protein
MRKSPEEESLDRLMDVLKDIHPDKRQELVEAALYNVDWVERRQRLHRRFDMLETEEMEKLLGPEKVKTEEELKEEERKYGYDADFPDEGEDSGR